MRRVMDNDGTPKLTACYEVCPAQEARKLTKRTEVPVTPKQASWLNMVDIELAIFARQCLKAQRIPSPEMLKDLAQTCQTQRNQQTAKVHWTFRIPDARDKLERHYADGADFICVA